jgi:radical SAM superfamily enzyme YgiQ (UPF0313 family)
MKIRFIYPRFEKLVESHSELKALEHVQSVGHFRMPPALGIPILSALTPDEHEVCVFDENIEAVDYDDDSDVIAISFFTPQATSAYRMADEFRQRGKTVIGGGMHPSQIPEEAEKHFDAICVGEAEGIWQDILADLEKGELKPRYESILPDLSLMPIPDRSVFTDLKGKRSYDWEANMVQVMRGCTYKCESCIVPVQCGKDFRFRPIKNVIEDIESLDLKEFFFTDDSLVLHDEECQAYMTELMAATQELNARIFISSTLNMNCDKAYLDSLVKGGVVSLYLVTGFDPTSILAFKPKGKLHFKLALENVKKMQDAGLHCFLSFGLGFDQQDESIFDIVLDFAEKSGVETSEFFLLTPFPGTPAYSRLKNRDRILHYDWEKYNTSHVVFQPKRMSPERLQRGFIDCWLEFYKNRTGQEAVDIFTQGAGVKT